MDYVADFARRGFERLGLELLGVVPMQKMLSEPSLEQIAATISGEFLCNRERSRNLATNVVIGAVSSANLLRNITLGTLLVVPGDREDLVLAAISQEGLHEQGLLSGLVLSDGLKPHPQLIKMLAATILPVVYSKIESYAIAQKIHSLTIKIEPGNLKKIHHIQELIARHLDIPRLLEKIGLPREFSA